MPLSITLPRIRVFILSYAASISLLCFFVCLVFLPVAPNRALPIIIVVLLSLITSAASLLALFGPKLACFPQCLKSPQVSLELLGIIILIPISVAEATLSEDIGRSPYASTSLNTAIRKITPAEYAAALTLCNLIIILSSSTAFLLTAYATFIASLAFYTQRKSHSTRIWTQRMSESAYPFIFPPFLHYMRATDSDIDRLESGLSVRADLQSQRLLTASFSLNGLPGELLGNPASRRSTQTHLHLPGCMCDEKPDARPSHPEEFRLVHQALQAAWCNSAGSRSSCTQWHYISRQSNGRDIGHRRAASAPVAMIRIPTDRAIRRSLYQISFDAA